MVVPENITRFSSS